MALAAPGAFHASAWTARSRFQKVTARVLAGAVIAAVGFASGTSLRADTLNFAVIGDFGNTGSPAGTPHVNSGAVANLVHSWSPQLIATVGDLNYGSVTSPNPLTGWDHAVGQYYGQYIKYPAGSTSAYAGNGLTTNNFLPVLGNHDHDYGVSSYSQYFTFPPNTTSGRYYSERRGPVEFFIVDSDPREPDDGNPSGAPASATVAANSTQGQWLKNGLQNSTAPFQVVLMHHPAYSSGNSHGNTSYMQLPYREWGADVVFAGHDHVYERIIHPTTGLPYLTVGTGGRSLNGFIASPVAGSQSRIAEYGALKVTATDTQMLMQFYNTSGTLLDSYTATPLPALPPTTTVTFQQGAAGYTSAADTQLRQAAADANTSFATTTPLVVDTDDPSGTGNDSQALIRFRGLFGGNPGQVPLNATITGATLTITTGSASNDNSANTISLYRMKTGWEDTSTWTSLTSGVSRDGVEAFAAAESSGVGNTLGGAVNFDVTLSLQQFLADYLANATQNNGWVLINDSTDGWRFNSSEFATVAGRPLLSVTYTTPNQVPEPATLAVLAIGALGLAARRHEKNRRCRS